MCLQATDTGVELTAAIFIVIGRGVGVGEVSTVQQSVSQYFSISMRHDQAWIWHGGGFLNQGLPAGQG